MNNNYSNHHRHLNKYFQEVEILNTKKKPITTSSHDSLTSRFQDQLKISRQSSIVTSEGLQDDSFGQFLFDEELNDLPVSPSNKGPVSFPP
jgi:hypothetical protein